MFLSTSTVADVGITAFIPFVAESADGSLIFVSVSSWAVGGSWSAPAAPVVLTVPATLNDDTLIGLVRADVRAKRIRQYSVPLLYCYFEQIEWSH